MQRSPSMQNPVKKRRRAKNLRRRRKKKKKLSQRRAEGGGMIRAPVSVGVHRGPPPVNVGAMVSLRRTLGRSSVITDTQSTPLIGISKSHCAYLWLY